MRKGRTFALFAALAALYFITLGPQYPDLEKLHVPSSLIKRYIPSFNQSEINEAIKENIKEDIKEDIKKQNEGVDLQGKPYKILLDQFNKSDQSIQVLHDVCIIKRSNVSDETVMVIFDPNIKSDFKKIVVTHGYYTRFTVRWPVIYKKMERPKSLVYRPYPAFFIFDKYPTNLFHLIHDGMVGMYGQLKRTGRLMAEEGNHIFLHECTKRETFKSFILQMSPNLHYGDCFRQSTEHGICFHDAIYGFWREPTEVDYIKHMHEVYNITSCSQPLITLLGRNVRQILNLPELEASLAELNLTRTKIQSVWLEKLTLKEQVQTMHCTRVLVGVHGAGMVWYKFLPPKAAVLELGWHRWAPRQFAFMGKRNGLYTDTFSAGHNVTLRWDLFQPAQGIANLTEADKKRLLNLPGPGYSSEVNVYKNSDGWFNATLFRQKVKGLVEKQRKDGVEF